MKLLFPKQNYNVLLPVPTLIYLWEIYKFQRSVWLFCCRKILYVDRTREYINRSQTHEGGNWDWGRAIPRNGIHKWDFTCSAAPSFLTSLLVFLLRCSVTWPGDGGGDGAKEDKSKTAYALNFLCAFGPLCNHARVCIHHKVVDIIYALVVPICLFCISLHSSADTSPQVYCIRPPSYTYICVGRRLE
jgi:hypothetical protein